MDPLELPRTEARLRALGFTEEVLAVRRMNFAGLPGLLPEVGGALDFILADLGVSSMQIDNPARGFTFRDDGPLDLSLNPNRGRPASEFLEAAVDGRAGGPAERAFRRALRPRHRPGAARTPVATTRQLAALVRKAGRPPLDQETCKEEVCPAAATVLQALRIAVNDELGVLDQFLALLPRALKPGGRAAILTFHIGEDRRVKKAFQAGLRDGVYAPG